jgi:hypothetical protein
MRRHPFAACVVALGLTFGVAAPSWAAKPIPTPSHKLQQIFLKAMKGILPENTAVHRTGLIDLGEETCTGLNQGYSVKKLIQFTGAGKSGRVSKDTVLVMMSFATATFCPQYHSEVEKVIDRQP